jgi:hypothetical protein
MLTVFHFSAYYAQVAGLYYSISHTDAGFQVFGFSIISLNLHFYDCFRPTSFKTSL